LNLLPLNLAEVHSAQEPVGVLNPQQLEMWNWRWNFVGRFCFQVQLASLSSQQKTWTGLAQMVHGDCFLSGSYQDLVKKISDLLYQQNWKNSLLLNQNYHLMEVGANFARTEQQQVHEDRYENLLKNSLL
jgi:hypothetical protein